MCSGAERYRIENGQVYNLVSDIPYKNNEYMVLYGVEDGVKRLLGIYTRYDYIKILSVGRYILKYMSVQENLEPSYTKEWTTN